MTKTEIKSALTVAGIEFRAKATLEQLQALHATMLEGSNPKRNPDGTVSLEKDDFTMPQAELDAQVMRNPAPEEVEPPVEAPTEAVAPATPAGNGLKIEKDRLEQNGIKRPSVGGKCRAIWDALDAHAEATGDDPTAKDVKALAAAHGWNPNNASIEFYQWRKFQGITKKG